MALNSRTYRESLNGVSGLQTMITISDLVTLMEDNSSAMVDVYSWASSSSMPYNIKEFSSFNHKQLLIRKTSGTLTIQNNQTIHDNTTITGAWDIVWLESMSSNDLVLEADITGLNVNVFRRAYVRFINA